MEQLTSYLKKVWDRMANEYYSQEHKTSRNFDTVIHNRLLEIIPRLDQNGLYLDLGGGRGRLKELYTDTKSRVVVGDLSLAMIKTRTNSPPSASYVQMDAFRMPFRPDIFDGVFSLLGDPYSLREAFKEVYRILKLDGLFLIALPTKLWAENLRPFLGVKMDQTMFKTRNGKTMKIPSFLYEPKELRDILLEIGFKKVKTGDWRPLGLISEEQFSRDVLISSNNLDIPPQELPLITYALAYKIDFREKNHDEQ